MSRARLWRAVRAAFSAAVAVVFVVVVVDAARHLSGLSLRVHAGWLALAWPLALASFPLLPVAWASLLAAYDHGIGRRQAVTLWCLAQASRYLPTGLAAVASRAVLAADEGVPKRVTVMTIVVEGALVVAWSGMAGGAVWWPAGAAGAVAVVAVPAALIVLRRPPRPRSVWVADAVVGVNMAAKATAFVLFAHALLPVRSGDTALLVGGVNLAVAAGMIGVTPAGLGVREGVLGAVLGHRFGAANAAALAVALRAWDVSVEVPWVLGAVALRRRGRTPAAPA